MTSILLAAAIMMSPPVAPTRTGRLAAYIGTINPNASPYAKRLAGAILGASRRHRINPHMLAAICWSESYFQLQAPGASGELGPYQIIGRFDLVSWAWDDAVQAMYGLPDYPDAWWHQYDRETQAKALRDPVLSTYMAAAIVAWHQARCMYPGTARCAARYNSGGPDIRWGYAHRLARRAYHIRRAVDADVE